MNGLRDHRQKTAIMVEPGNAGLRPVSLMIVSTIWFDQNETTPNSINKTTMLSGTPSNHKTIGIRTSCFSIRG